MKSIACLSLKGLILCFILSFSISVSHAQEPAKPKINVSGKVSDEKGNPLQGITVQLKDGQVVAVSGKDGTFKASVNPDATLVFTAVDHSIQEISVNNQSSVNVVMNVNAKSLDDVVVIGYGTQRKRATARCARRPAAERWRDGIFLRSEGYNNDFSGIN